MMTPRRKPLVCSSSSVGAARAARMATASGRAADNRAATHYYGSSSTADHGDGIRWDVGGPSDEMNVDAQMRPAVLAVQVPTTDRPVCNGANPLMTTVIPPPANLEPPPLPPGEAALVDKCTEVMSKVYGQEDDGESEEEAEWDEESPFEDEARALAFQTQLDNVMRKFWGRVEGETRVRLRLVPLRA